MITVPPELGHRLVWVDVARGALIILVVFYHVVAVHLATTGTPPAGPASHLLDTLVAGLRPLRMPLFFLISGFLAIGAITRPWPDLVRTRVALFAYVYVVWLVIQTAVLQLIGDGELVTRFGAQPYNPDTPWNPVLGLLANATFSPTSLWFVFALALYFPLAKLLARVRVLAISSAALLYLVSVEGWPGLQVGQLPAVAAYLVFFLLGAYGRDTIAALARRPDWRLAALAVVAFVGAQIVELQLSQRVPVLLGVASIGGTYLGITCAVAVSRHLSRSTTVLSYLGSRTLPIYVIHMPVLWLLHAATEATGGSLAAVSSGVVIAVYAIGATTVTLGGALAVASAMQHGAPWLFRLPRRGRHRAALAPRPAEKAPIEFDFDFLAESAPGVISRDTEEDHPLGGSNRGTRRHDASQEVRTPASVRE